MDQIMEDHIKYEAEESEQIEEEEMTEEEVTENVWEEVVIDDTSIPTWTEDVEGEDDLNADFHMESMSDDIPTSVVVVNPNEEEIDDNVVYVNPSENNKTGALISKERSTVEETTPAGTSRPNLQPIVTSVTSLARPMQKIINLNQLKLLPKGSFVNIGNRKMKLVTVAGDKKLIPGKMVTVSKGDNKLITGKVVNLGSPNKMMSAKVMSYSGNSSYPANIVNNKVVPAKVVSIANSKLKPISSSSQNKEVTIYITGIAGDKVQIRDSNRLQTIQKVSDDDNWKSDHYDACLPSDGSDGVASGTEVTEGHFLLDGQLQQQQGYNTSTLTCHICERQFTQLKYLLSHQQTHILAEPVSCDSCDKRFKRRYDLLRHKRRAHAAEITYQCDVCQQTFTDRQLANKHRLTHTEDFKYCCEVCHRPFKQVHDLKRHRSIHFDEKPFDCQICGKKFKHKSNLKTHQATHYSEKPYACTLCEKRFHQKGNLKTHLIVHTGEMPFLCSLCNKRFHTRSGLLNHSYSHSEEKPFQCDICEKTFNWKSGLLTHQLTHRRTTGAVVMSQQVLPEDVEVIEIGPIPVDN